MEYFQIDGCPPGKQYFRCQPLSATLGVEACASNWRRAQDAEETGLWRCRVCPTGALHAGETAANLWQHRGATICSRCQRGAARLIKGWLCVSCYNREREFIRGANAKGSYPAKMLPLGRRELRVMIGDKRTVVSRALTQDVTELMVATLRDSRERVTFAFWGGAQARLAQLPLF